MLRSIFREIALIISTFGLLILILEKIVLDWSKRYHGIITIVLVLIILIGVFGDFVFRLSDLYKSRSTKHE